MEMIVRQSLSLTAVGVIAGLAAALCLDSHHGEFALRRQRYRLD